MDPGKTDNSLHLSTVLFLKGKKPPVVGAARMEAHSESCIVPGALRKNVQASSSSQHPLSTQWYIATACNDEQLVT